MEVWRRVQGEELKRILEKDEVTFGPRLTPEGWG